MVSSIKCSSFLLVYKSHSLIVPAGVDCVLLLLLLLLIIIIQNYKKIAGNIIGRIETRFFGKFL